MGHGYIVIGGCRINDILFSTEEFLLYNQYIEEGPLHIFNINGHKKTEFYKIFIKNIDYHPRNIIKFKYIICLGTVISYRDKKSLVLLKETARESESDFSYNLYPKGCTLDLRHFTVKDLKYAKEVLKCTYPEDDYGFNKETGLNVFTGTELDSSGRDIYGFDREGYDRAGYNKAGYNKEGYNRYGYNKKGFNSLGYDKEGYDKKGYNNLGVNREGFNKDGKRIIKLYSIKSNKDVYFHLIDEEFPDIKNSNETFVVLKDSYFCKKHYDWNDYMYITSVNKTEKSIELKIYLKTVAAYLKVYKFRILDTSDNIYFTSEEFSRVSKYIEHKRIRKPSNKVLNLYKQVNSKKYIPASYKAISGKYTTEETLAKFGPDTDTWLKEHSRINSIDPYNTHDYHSDVLYDKDFRTSADLSACKLKNEFGVELGNILSSVLSKVQY